MPTVSYFARGDSSTANNPQFNPTNTNTTPTTLLTFTSEASGDILLDYNNGLPDPDTQVTLDGVTQSFIVEQQGYLPTTGQGANALRNVNGLDLRGQRLVVISIQGQRYFILPDLSLSLETMNAFPNGGLQLTDVTTGGPPVVICFVAGTLILTPEGERLVEALTAGDLVSNVEGEACPLLWVARRRVTPAELARHPELCPVRLPADLFGPGLPHHPLEVSPQHRILVAGWPVELAFGLDRALVPAKHLIGDRVAPVARTEAVDYFHLLFERHEIIVSNGLPSESLQPTAANVRDLAPEARAELALLFPEGVPEDLAIRSAAAATTKAYEGRFIADALVGHAWG